MPSSLIEKTQRDSDPRAHACGVGPNAIESELKGLLVATLCPEEGNTRNATNARKTVVVTVHGVRIGVPILEHLHHVLKVIDRGVVFPIPDVVFIHASVPWIQPFAQERNEFRLVVPFRLLQSIECLTSGIQTSACKVRHRQQQAGFVVVPTGLREDFLGLLGGLRPQPAQRQFPHSGPGFFMSNEGFVVGVFSVLKTAEHVQIVVLGRFVDHHTKGVAFREHDCTVPTTVWVDVETKAAQTAKLADGRKPCEHEDGLTHCDEHPRRQQTHLFIEILAVQPIRVGHDVAEFLVAHQEEKKNGVARKACEAKGHQFPSNANFASDVPRRSKLHAEGTTEGLPTEQQVARQFENERQSDDGDVQ